MNRWRSFLECFACVVERHGDAPAIYVQGHPVLSYAQLFRRACGVAARLRMLGAGRETVVGLGLEKSPDYVASLLGAWLVGAAFVPLDPRLPPERLRFMVEQAKVKIVLAGPDDEALFDGMSPTVSGADLVRETEALPPLPPIRPEDLAYVIFTSGSTGQPKGVMVEHRGIVNLVEAQIDAFQLRPGCRALFYLSTSFDASVSDIGTALLSGAALCLEPPESLQPGAPLGAIMSARGITHTDLPPSLLRVMSPSDMPECLETVVIGGEACPPAVVRKWAARFRIVNVYGPTEATVCSSLCVCDPVRYRHALIGQPVPNVLYHILDSDMNESAPGLAGELYIGGIGLARGYANQPELTAARFIFREGQRLYRTGDRVIRELDGEMRFLGRMDRQVKVRGLLIEPEEIERRLMEHPRVQRAAVVKRLLRQQPPREGLVAFIVPESAGNSGDIPHAELSAFLCQRLPRWMVPHRYEFLDRLPVMPSGKVDPESLQGRELSSRNRPAAGTEPLTGQAAVLAGIWEQVLGVEAVSMSDDFLGLGGDSLALLEATAASEARGLRIPPALLAERWTLGQIVAWLRRPAEMPPGAMSVDELTKDIDLGPEILGPGRSARERASAREGSRKAAVIFLTGTTGFLGSRLLAELLQRTDGEFHCLVRVRAGHTASALERVRVALAGHGIELSPAQARRVSIVHGDLSQSRFGLSVAEWERLAAQVDTVYHCGAIVNIVQPYQALRAANVLGTREALRLACHGYCKRLHYASTLSVFVASDRNHGTLTESDDLRDTRYVFGGYAQSKWTAERLLRAAGSDAISCYRFGLITGDSRTGYCSSRDQLALFIRGLVELGCIPAREAHRLKMDITPVDYAAAAMAHLSLNCDDDNRPSAWHLANPRSVSLSELADALGECGITIDRVSDDEWTNRSRRRFGDGAADKAEASEAAAAYLSLCRSMADESGDAFERYRTMDLFQATGVEFAMGRTLAALAGSGVSCPAPDQALLRTYVTRILSRSS
jgi:amino acid adenylation domain-containing protein/thioester reductase-like protein